MEKAVIALKVKSDKAGIKTAIYQTYQLCLQAWKSGIEVIDCIVTFGGSKDIIREVKVIDAKARFDTLLIYSPSQVCKEKQEFIELESVLANNFQIKVRYLRSGT